MAAPSRHIDYTTCTCGKRSYYSRADAKRAGNKHHTKVRVYQCRHAEGVWHLTRQARWWSYDQAH